jgi:PKD repeat protein
MKKITKLFNLLAISILAGLGSHAKAQCTANFTWTNGANGVVTFTSTSAPATSLTAYYWSFGNGATYTAMGISGAAASQQYTANGTYSVTLFILSSSPSCSNAVTYTVSVSNASGSGCNLNANWSNSQGGPGTMNFNNNTTGTVSATTYTWDYGDGNTSNSYSGPHTYASNGVYIVTLYASNNTTPACVSSHSAQATITTVCNLNASFNITNGSNGSVSFVSTSTGTSAGTYHTWDFGDGSPLNHAVSPTHVYDTGNYLAVLTLANSSVSPNCTDSIGHPVSVTNTCIANANFTLQPSGTPQLWNAIPASTANIVAAQWAWGDGSTSNTLFTSHQYSTAGMYSLCLSVTVSCGASAMSCSSYSVYRSSGFVNVNVISAESVGLADNSLLSGNLVVFPNPSNGQFNLELKGNGDKVRIEITNLVGQLVYSSEEHTNGTLTKMFDLSDLQNGIYFVKVSQDNQSATTKISIHK